MKTGNLFLMTGIFLFLSGCVTDQAEKEEYKGLMGVQSILWTQYAAEVEALYLQGYNIASGILLNYDMTDADLPPAVTLDIDETVLDNSPFNVHMLRTGADYSEALWAQWCRRVEALPLPGALDFVRLADSLGFEVFYVSNRHDSLMDVTIENLKRYNFPFADTSHILLKTTTSSKDDRRDRIRQTHQIVLLAGDNLGDFRGIFDDRDKDFGKASVRALEEEFGTRFIMFPNAIYGSWQRAVFPEGMPGERDVLQNLKGYNQ